MGYYTEFVLAIQLRRDIPPDIIKILNYLIHPSQMNWEMPEIKTPHLLFETGHLDFLLCGDSYYFPGKSNSQLEFDEISQAYFLTVRSNLKNYDREIEKFLHWIAPFSQTGTLTPGTKKHPPTGPGRYFAGYFCTGEEDSLPTLVFLRDGKAYLAEVPKIEWQEIKFSHP